MNTCRIRLRLLSPLGTPLVADTLFGHLCWGIAYHDGPDAVSTFLEQMASPEPPLVISDPLPAGFWPAPTLPHLSAHATRQMADQIAHRFAQPGDSAAAAHRRATDWLRDVQKSRQWVRHETLARVTSNLGRKPLLRAWAEEMDRQPAQPPALTEALVAHNSIDPLTGRPREPGGFYFLREWFPADQPGQSYEYDVWARSPWPPERLRALFEQGLRFGYGRDASTGRGCLEVLSVQPADLPTVAQPNALMTLGVCAPAAHDPPGAFWQIDVRLGRLGGPLAAMASDDTGLTPFKRPVIFLRRGSIMISDQPPPVVGRMITDVHPQRPEIMTCGLTLTLPLRLDEETLACQPTI